MKLIDINKELSQNFLDFSYEANVQRAFADARDGLKPGQRASLWEMYVKGYTSNKPHVKAAKISGGVIATWWPHGSTAVYETFARMSQDWINNIPEVDWHGANGSIQISGDPAADRYCEARLSKSSEDGLFQGIKKNNVPMKLNFSEDEEWPEVLPAIYPRLMVNGCQGIGSTIANVWLPHCLDEVVDSIFSYVTTGKIDYSKLAPSFPSGGVIINKDELESIYTTGKGKVVLRGKAHIEGKCIYITELPYQIYVEPYVDSVKQLIMKDEIDGISNILNKSSKKNLLIEIECEVDPQKVLDTLYKKTELQKNYNANQYALISKTPKLLTYKEYLDVYLAHNYECIKREYSFDLEKSKKRLEIVVGLLKALEDIDNIIAIIKKSESSAAAKLALIERYDFTEVQAKAILDMKLSRLAHLEKVELNKEQEQLTSTIADCQDIIKNKTRQIEIFKSRLSEFVKKYGDSRRTELLQLEEASSVSISAEPTLISIAPNFSARKVSRKTKDLCVNTDKLHIFTNFGQCYKLPVDQITSTAQKLSSLLSLKSGEEIVGVYDGSAPYLLFVTSAGLVKKTAAEEYTTSAKSCKAIKLKEGDLVHSVLMIAEEDITLITQNSLGLCFSSIDISSTGKAAQGVIGIKLAEGDKIEKAFVGNKFDLSLGKRAAKGKKFDF